MYRCPCKPVPDNALAPLQAPQLLVVWSPGFHILCRLLVGELSVLIAGAGRTATPGRWPCRDGAGACARARIQRPSGGGEVRTRPVPASVNGAEITFIQGDIVTSLADLLVNPVDCAGAMTDGATRRFKAVYPKVHREYRAECLEGIVKPGTVRLLRGKDGGRLIANLTVRDTPGTPCRAELVVRGNHRTEETHIGQGNGNGGNSRDRKQRIAGPGDHLESHSEKPGPAPPEIEVYAQT